MSKQWVELTPDVWVDATAVYRVTPVDRKAGQAKQSRIYFEGAASGVPVDLSVPEVMKLLRGGGIGQAASVNTHYRDQNKKFENLAAEPVKVPAGPVDELVALMRDNYIPWATNSQHQESRRQQALAILAAGYTKVEVDVT